MHYVKHVQKGTKGTRFDPHKSGRNCYNQARFQSSKYTENAFAARPRPGNRWGSLQRSPDLVAAWFGRKEEGGEGKREGKA